jgi:hypothetical protein
MPNRTIYVADDDAALFQRAQELSGDSLSAVIARAVRRFVESEEGRRHGFEEVTVQVGPFGARTKKRFGGIRLAGWKRMTDGSRIIPNAQASDWGYSQQYQDRGNWHMAWGSWEQPGEYQLDVFDDVEPLKERLPEELYQAVSQAMRGPAIEDLDI